MSSSQSASTSSLPLRQTWEDDAWKSDSDDDEFVKASRIGSSSSTSSSSTTPFNILSNNGSNNNHKSKAGTARHAPPARPHPFPVNIDESRSSSRSIPKVQVISAAERPSIGGGGSSSSSSSSNSTNTLVTHSGWTLIERTGSGTSASGTTSGSGHSPTPGVEAVGRSDEENGGLGKRRESETEAKQMTASIRNDLDRVLQDPTEILLRLSLRSNTKAESSRANSYSETDPCTKTPALSSSISELASSSTQGLGTVMASSTGDVLVVKQADLPSDEVIQLPEGLLERKSSFRTERRRTKFLDCLEEEVVQMDKLRSLAWAGVPEDMRPMIWMLLLGYLPPARTARASTLARKRAEYQAGVRLAFQRGNESLDQAIWHQIHIDVPRTNPGISLWQRQATQRALERILYVWAIRHPASGYVQGINDLATPFFQVFLGAYISSDVEQYDVALLPPAALEALEADTFWCLSKLLDGIQDNYIFAQPGIQRQVRRMGELVGRINPPLHSHLEEQGVEYIQFAFRWMNCLLMRELSVRNIVRMWDTYLAEGPDAFSDFHLYVCSSFLNRWDEELRKMDFQGIIMFLQSLPTQKWTAQETELLLADAFVKKSLFGGTAHLTN